MPKNYTFILILSLLCLSTLSIGQINQFEWGLKFRVGYGGLASGQIPTKAIVADASGSVIIADVATSNFMIGNTYIPLTGLNGAMFTTKIDETGNTEWLHLSPPTDGGYGWPRPYGIDIDKKGDVYIVGDAFSNSVVFHGVPIYGPIGDAFAIKVNNDGSLRWANILTGQELKSVNVHNNTIRIGGTQGNFYIKMDTVAGNIQTQTSGQQLQAFKIVTDNQGYNYILDSDGNGFLGTFSVGGLTYTPPANSANNSSMILKQDSLGNSIWLKHFFSESASINNIEVDNNGHLYVLGTVHNSIQLDSSNSIINPNNGSGNTDFSNFVAKFDQNMNVIWYETVGGFSSNTVASEKSIMSLELDFRGNVYVAVASGTGHWIGDYQITIPNNHPTSVVAKFSPNGEVIWVRSVKGYNNGPLSLAVTPTDVYLYGVVLEGEAFFQNETFYYTSEPYRFLTKLSNTAATNKVSGLIFYDDNENGIRDSLEIGVNNGLINFNDDYYKSTDTNGYFSNYLYDGTYTMSAVLPNYWYQTTPDTVITVSNSTNIDSLEIGVKYNSNIHDLEVYISSTAIRPGFEASYWVSYKNTGTKTMSGTVELMLEDTLTYLYSQPIGNYTAPKVTWTFDSLQVGESRFAEVRCLMPPATGLLGSDLNATATINPVANDITVSNNSFLYSQTVTGSYDPNDKQVNPNTDIDTNFVNDGTFFYTIRFQNTGNDTAFIIRVADTLDSHLDINTFQMVGASHNYKFELKDNAIMWTFENVLLPDSNTNEAASHGFIQYTIRPKSSVVLGNSINNTAHIYFDFNPAIVTNTTTNTVEVISQTHQVQIDQLENVNVYPNPTNGLLICEIEDFQHNEQYLFKLYDMRGKEVLVEHLSTNTHHIDLQSLPMGMYVYQVIGRGNVFKGVGKVLIQY